MGNDIFGDLSGLEWGKDKDTELYGIIDYFIEFSPCKYTLIKKLDGFT